ncbi:MAG: AAA family ATPase, partial [Candidatus Cloacimonadota bacterium]|nr:AAA family ATPase [Candidatus Cloacimonadota bacterium]
MREQVREFFKEEINQFNNFITQVLCDSTGRFFVSKEGRKNNAFKLGKEIFTEDQFIDYIVERIKKNEDKPKSESNPKITVLIGPPASGKTHWRDENITNEVVISRDDELMNYAKDNAIEGNYSDVWKYLEENDLQKEVDKMVQDKFKDAMKFRKDIVIDMTNMPRKSRRKWFNTVPKEYV